MIQYSVLGLNHLNDLILELIFSFLGFNVTVGVHEVVSLPDIQSGLFLGAVRSFLRFPFPYAYVSKNYPTK
jgi:hypothetical protein